MPRLWVGNCDTEYMVSRLDRLSPNFRDFSSALGKRLVWLLRDGDVLLVPRPIGSVFIDYAAALAGFDPTTVHIVSPNCEILTEDALHEPELLGQLRQLVGPDWELRPYLHDRGATALGRALGLPIDQSQPFHAQGGAELFNSKIIFRALATGLGVPIPEGTACRTRGDLQRALEELLTRTPAVMIKRDRESGGYGNFVVTTQPDLPIVGAQASVHVTGPKDFEKVAAFAALASTHVPQREVVVEAYHPHCRSVFVEICCPGHDAQPHLLDTGQLRMASDPPVWVGFVMPLPALPGAAYELITTHALRLAQTMQHLGYTGLVNIDAIVSETGTVWFNEINARLGGSTHLHHLAQSLLGERWADSHVLLSHNQVRAPAFPQLLNLLDQHGLAWDPSAQQGVIIAVDHTEHTGTIEYLILAPDIRTGQHIERHLNHALADGINTLTHDECTSVLR